MSSFLFHIPSSYIPLRLKGMKIARGNTIMLKLTFNKSFDPNMRAIHLQTTLNHDTFWISYLLIYLSIFHYSCIPQIKYFKYLFSYNDIPHPIYRPFFRQINGMNIVAMCLTILKSLRYDSVTKIKVYLKRVDPYCRMVMGGLHKNFHP